MASITQVGNRWRAQCRRAGHDSIAKTFATRREAEAWAKKTDAAMKAGRPAPPDPNSFTVAGLVARFRRMRTELGRPVNPASNTEYMLQHLAEDLGDETVDELTPDRLVLWARERQKQGAGPPTVNMELSQLSTVLRHVGSSLNIVFPDVVGTARPLLHYGQLIGGGTKRTRRPTEDELVRLLEHLRIETPIVAAAVEVSAITGMRRGELARIAWSDVDEVNRAVLVRQRKHPRRILARDEWVPLLGDSWRIVKAMKKLAIDDRVFPVSAEKLTDSVTAATRALGIPNLHLHDMRREATSRLRELGFDREERKAIVGHKSDEVHDRYVAVTLESLHQKHDAARGTRPRPARPRRASDHPTAAKRTRRASDDS